MSGNPSLNGTLRRQAQYPARAPGASAQEMTRGLGGPRVKHDWRVREAEGGFCAPVCKENVGAEQRFRSEKEDFLAGFREF